MRNEKPVFDKRKDILVYIIRIKDFWAGGLKLKSKKILIIICISLLIYYTVAFFNTDEVLNDFKKCITYQTSADSALDKYLGAYNYNDTVSNAKISISRRLVLHNFHKGLMYVNYTYYLYNSSGEEIGGSYNVNSLWFIKKRNNKWCVYDIKERP